MPARFSLREELPSPAPVTTDHQRLVPGAPKGPSRRPPLRDGETEDRLQGPDAELCIEPSWHHGGGSGSRDLGVPSPRSHGCSRGTGRRGGEGTSTGLGGQRGRVPQGPGVGWGWPPCHPQLRFSPPGAPPRVLGTYLSAVPWGGPMGPGGGGGRCRAGTSPAPSSPPGAPLPCPCLFRTLNKPGTTWQISSSGLLTLCPAPLRILRRPAPEHPDSQGAPP